MDLAFLEKIEELPHPTTLAALIDNEAAVASSAVNNDGVPCRTRLRARRLGMLGLAGCSRSTTGILSCSFRRRKSSMRGSPKDQRSREKCEDGEDRF